MVENFYKSDYLLIDYDPENRLLLTKWFPAAEGLDFETFKKEIWKYVDAVHKYDVKGILVDTLDMVFPLTPELNEWIVNNVTPHYVETGVKKLAYVLPKEIISRMGVQMLVEEAYKKAGEVKRLFFDNVPEALEWLKS